jgi:proteic killer suppression protein
MNFRFRDEVLRRMYTELDFDGGYGRPVVRAFRKVMNAIRAAMDERDFYPMRSLHFEKLKGNRSHQRSMRLNDQWRLILEIEEATPKNTIIVVGIEDYHR